MTLLFNLQDTLLRHYIKCLKWKRDFLWFFLYYSLVSTCILQLHCISCGQSVNKLNVDPMDGQYWNFLVTIGVFRSVVEKRFSFTFISRISYVTMIPIFGCFVSSFDWYTGRLCDSKEVKIWKDYKKTDCK